MSFADMLAAAIRAKNSRVCVGLDPRMDCLPPEIQGDPGARVFEFCSRICDAVAPFAVAVKPQSAYFEALGPEGVKALWQVIDHAREQGLAVILDAKRNDIGSTAEAYVKSCLGLFGGAKMPRVDAVTVNAYLGIDGVRPFIQAAYEHGTGLYVLVKTSNPSSGDLQDMRLEGGKAVYEHLADLVAKWGDDLVGECGYSSVGAVVGATYPKQLANLRRAMPRTPFLVPGYGHQGGTATDAAPAFGDDGRGAVVNSSRGIIQAWQSSAVSGGDFAAAAAAAAKVMRDDLNSAGAC